MGKSSSSWPLTSLMQQIEDLPQQSATAVARLGRPVDYRPNPPLLVDDRPDRAAEPLGHGVLGLVGVGSDQDLGLALVQLGNDRQAGLFELERVGLLRGGDLGCLV